jgi:ABC-type multidrug transport system fused ATPase/permease subunit
MGVCLEVAGVLLGVIGPLALKALIDGFNAPGGGREVTGFLAFAFVFAWAAGGVLATWRLVYSSRVIDSLTADLAAGALAGELPRVAASRDGDSGRTLGLIERLPYSLLVVVDGLIWRSRPLMLQIIASVWVISGLIPVRYAGFLLLVLGVYTWLSWRGAVRHRDHASVANLAAASVSKNLGDVLRNARRVVLNGMLRPEVKGIESVIGEKARANRRMMWSLVGAAAQQYGWLGFGLVVLLIVATSDVHAGHMTVGDFIMLETYALRLALPLSGLGFLLSQSASAIANIRDVLTLSAPVALDRNHLTVSTEAASIRLDRVSFQYPGTASGIQHVSAEIAAGSFAVIVGPNGSGKSTLAQLISGVFDPDEGSIDIAGQNITNFAPADRHKWALYVPQFVTFLNRSLRENALYPPTRASEGDLTSLLKQWRFYEAGRSIDFNAPVGELGDRLSGGQRQKIELARVAGVSVPVLVLDESTSALDPASENRVLDVLKERFRGRTTIVMVTHRRHLAETADTVLFMSDGRLVGQGRHADLKAQIPAYARLFGL